MSASLHDIPPIASTQLVRPTNPGNEADVVSGYPASDSDHANNVNEKPCKIVITVLPCRDPVKTKKPKHSHPSYCTKVLQVKR